MPQDRKTSVAVQVSLALIVLAVVKTAGVALEIPIAVMDVNPIVTPKPTVVRTLLYPAKPAPSMYVAPSLASAAPLQSSVASLANRTVSNPNPALRLQMYGNGLLGTGRLGITSILAALWT